MSISEPFLWVSVCAIFYAAAVMFWSRVAALRNSNGTTWFSAGHELPSWVGALLMAGAGVSGWFILGGTQEITKHGFSLPGILQAGVMLCLPGVLFFKRLWYVGQRLRVSSQAELFRVYYRSEFLVFATTFVALMFAVGFSGLQLRFVSEMLATLGGDIVSSQIIGFLIVLLLFGYVVIGGMRAIGFVGAVQAVLLLAAIVFIAGYALYVSGGIEALVKGLQAKAGDPASAVLFEVSGVLQFSAGLGRDNFYGHGGTAVMSLGLALAFMGFQTSPLAAKIVLSMKSADGIAASQTWLQAAFIGGLIVAGIVLIGAAGFVNSEWAITGLLSMMQLQSAWFAAWALIAVVAGIQLLAGLGLLVASENLVRVIYKPYFQGTLDRKATVLLTRICVGLLALIALLMQSLAPVTLSAFAGLALPLSIQLFTPLLGITWFRWITRPAAICGVGFGMAAVMLTEPFGYQVLSYVGLELPWGRWPWTVHSAAWGAFFNILSVLVISAITNRTAHREEAIDIQNFLVANFGLQTNSRVLKPIAWSAALAWLFFAIGPGLVFGNFAFGSNSETEAEGGIWVFGIPSMWAWSILFWMLGVVLVWLLAYRMEMANMTLIDVSAYEPKPRLRKNQSDKERERIRFSLGFVASVGSIIVLLAWSFG